MTYNLIIIGSGPSGLSAALYAGRAGLSPIVFEGTANFGLYAGGQLEKCSSIENYLGIEESNGYELTEKFRNHALKYGVIIKQRTIIKVEKVDKNYIVTDDLDEKYETKSLIIATGATAKKVGVINEDKFFHHGISACAVCDGSLPIFRNQEIAVIGGGDTAAEEALYLSKFASKIHLIHRGPKLRASKIMVKRLNENKKIIFHFNTVVIEADGDINLNSIKLRNSDAEETILNVKGMFYGIGHTPNTWFLKPSGIELDNDGYIVTNKAVFTNLDGVFACGDVCDKIYRQAITSAGTGCMAALEAERFISHH